MAKVKDSVNEIRNLYVNGVAVNTIAKQYGISKSTVYKYVKGVSKDNKITDEVIIEQLIKENNNLKLKLAHEKKQNAYLKEIIETLTNELNYRNNYCYELSRELQYLKVSKK